ncbi:hypothetical protein OROHE_019735 [Orobanche hederae]
MVEMHELVPRRRFDRYHELGQYAFGEKLGLYSVVPQQLIVEVGVDIVYMVTGGRSLKKFHDLVCEDSCKDIKLSHFIMIFASVHFVLSIFPTLIQALVCPWLPLSLLFYDCLGGRTGQGNETGYAVWLESYHESRYFFQLLQCLGICGFCICRSQCGAGNSSHHPFNTGEVFKSIVALCYFPVAFNGYRMFSNEVNDNILMTLQKPTWLIAMANMFVVIHVIGSYQIYAVQGLCSSLIPSCYGASILENLAVCDRARAELRLFAAWHGRLEVINLIQCLEILTEVLVGTVLTVARHLESLSTYSPDSKRAAARKTDIDSLFKPEGMLHKLLNKRSFNPRAIISIINVLPAKQ